MDFLWFRATRGQFIVLAYSLMIVLFAFGVLFFVVGYLAPVDKAAAASKAFMVGWQMIALSVLGFVGLQIASKKCTE